MAAEVRRERDPRSVIDADFAPLRLRCRNLASSRDSDRSPTGIRLQGGRMLAVSAASWPAHRNEDRDVAARRLDRLHCGQDRRAVGQGVIGDRACALPADAPGRAQDECKREIL